MLLAILTSPLISNVGILGKGAKSSEMKDLVQCHVCGLPKMIVYRPIYADGFSSL